MESENLGEVISGDRIENSVYKIEMKVPKQCEVACQIKPRKNTKDLFIAAIDNDYRIHWMVDNLPVGSYEKNPATNTDVIVRGFPVGFHAGGTGGSGGKKGNSNAKHFLYNHARIILQYHDDYLDENPQNEETTTKIVGFRVEPMSIKHSWEGGLEYSSEKTILTTCNAVKPATHDPKNFQSVDRLGTDSVLFTYDVWWEKSDVEWSNRWDIYLKANALHDKVHWFGITNSIMVVFFLTVMIALILFRALRRDIAQYNDHYISGIEDGKEESGWKLVHADVFRPPASYPMLFSVFVGSGAQLILMTLATLSFALMGLLSPANRGSLITAFIFFFVIMGSFAGYYSSMTYKMFKGVHWKENTLLSAFLYPGIVLGIFCVLNLVLWAERSSAALPFPTLFTLLFLWFCVSVPLVIIGSYFGYKKEVVTFPVRTQQIPRAIPVQTWYLHPLITIMWGGLLPFGAVAIELYSIMSALWLHQLFFVFGFLFIVLIILAITCAEVSILLVYLSLNHEDYRWWWRSFMSSGSFGLYVMLYAIWYNLTEMQMNSFVPMMLYFGYMSIISFTCLLIAGTIGYFASLWFNMQIYSSIKVD